MYGPILRQLRESKARTQADVARSVGISPAQLARLESNQRGLYVEDFIRIAGALGEKAGNLLPNDLGDIGHLKPLIDRLATVRPELLPRVAAIIEHVIKLTEVS
jgi:transcriptional regulator with XRE-family HTH domain